MSVADRLFQYQSTSTDTDLTDAELIYTAGANGPTMVTGLWFAPSAGGSNNIARLHHCKSTESVSASNVLFYATVNNSDSISEQYHSVRIILQPGDRLYTQLHSGSGFTLTGYGLAPHTVETMDTAPFGAQRLPFDQTDPESTRSY